jgi:hypothetical protein
LTHDIHFLGPLIVRICIQTGGTWIINVYLCVTTLIVKAVLNSASFCLVFEGRGPTPAL